MLAKKIPNLAYLQSLLYDVANKMFSNQSQLRAYEDAPVKAKYLFNLFKTADELSFDLSASKILDIGCSKCDVLLTLKKIGFTSLTGLNLFPYDFKWLSNSDYYEQNFGNSGNKIRYSVCDVDVNPFPFKDSSYDVILLFDVLEHLHDPKHVLSECRRVLSSGGLIVISTPNGANLKNRLYSILGKSVHPPINLYFDDKYRVNNGGVRRFTGHVREYTMKELESYMLQFFEFKCIFRNYFPSNIRNTSISYRVYEVLEKLFPSLRYHMFVIGQKPSSQPF